jgi:peroxiredoxin
MKKLLTPFLIFTLFGSFSVGCFNKNETSSSASTKLNENKNLQKLSEIKFKDLDNKTISLKNYRGYPVIVIFFSTECPACVRESQYLAKLYKENNEKVKVIALNLDIPREQAFILKEFKKELNIDYPIIPASPNVGKAWDILNVYTQSDFIPQMFIFDKEGNLRYYNVGFSDRVSQKLNEAINKLKKE